MKGYFLICAFPQTVRALWLRDQMLDSVDAAVKWDPPLTRGGAVDSGGHWRQMVGV